MEYIDPKTVLSPKGRVMNLEIVYDGGSWSFAVAKMTWDGTPNTYGIRWNGGSEENGKITKGSPISTGHPTWFILPSKFVKCVDFNRLLSEQSDEELIISKIVHDVELQQKNDPDLFSLSIFYEQLNIDVSTLEKVKQILSGRGITIVSHREKDNNTIFNIAYASNRM